MNYLYIALGIFCIFMIYGITIVLKFSGKRKLNPTKHKHFQVLLRRINKSLSSKEKIVDMDKLYHKVLLEIGYQGTFGEILKGVPNEISDINKVWEIHKLRNKLVHDFDNHDEKYLRKKANEYTRELEKLLENTK
ncbi:MAG: hypothetical protein GY828_05320 [Candidatus Gracilibacteria bacterium]|nr:hypothetical protein [Candidatus Gracilibacteria bacterium]